MELKNLINKLRPEAGDEEVENFIEANGENIVKNIVKLWDEYQQLDMQSQTIADDSTNPAEVIPPEPLYPSDEGNRQIEEKAAKAEDETQISESSENKLILDNDTTDNIANITDNLEIEDEEHIKNMAILHDEGQQAFDEKAKQAEKDKAYAMTIKNKHLTLPNGKVGQDYSVEFTIESIGLPEIAEVTFEGLENFGLLYYPDENRIKGKPQQPGDYKIPVKLKRTDWEEGKPVFEHFINIIINPDPRSLWQNIPTPGSTPYFKPDSDQQFLEIGKRRTKDSKNIIAASQRGRSHAHEGKPRDDDFGIYYDEPTGWYILAVADGAGSAKFSRKGSQIACETVIEVCKLQLPKLNDNLDTYIKNFYKSSTDEKRKPIGDSLYSCIGAAAFKAYKQIEKEASENNSSIKDYSTTLIITMAKKYKFGWFVGAFWVGDGGVGIYDKNLQSLKLLGEADGGEYAGQTRFLTMPEVLQPNEIYRRLRFGIVPNFTAVILMTDGITDPKFETDANLGRIEKWNALWEDLSAEVDFETRNEQTAEQLLSWLDFWSPGNHDDRTIAILY